MRGTSVKIHSLLNLVHRKKYNDKVGWVVSYSDGRYRLNVGMDAQATIALKAENLVQLLEVWRQSHSCTVTPDNMQLNE